MPGRGPSRTRLDRRGTLRACEIKFHRSRPKLAPRRAHARLPSRHACDAAWVRSIFSQRAMCGRARFDLLEKAGFRVPKARCIFLAATSWLLRIADAFEASSNHRRSDISVSHVSPMCRLIFAGVPAVLSYPEKDIVAARNALAACKSSQIHILSARRRRTLGGR